VRILPAGDTSASASASASPDLAADPDLILVAPALDAMYENGDNWPGAMHTGFVFSRECSLSGAWDERRRSAHWTVTSRTPS
jgi:hypothetical protein